MPSAAQAAHSISSGAFELSRPSLYCCVKLGKIILLPDAWWLCPKVVLGRLGFSIGVITGALSFSLVAAALARTSRSSAVPVRGSLPAFLSRSAPASHLTRPIASMRSKDIGYTVARGVNANDKPVLSLRRTAMIGRKGRRMYGVHMSVVQDDIPT